jgi:hypothetical protein
MAGHSIRKQSPRIRWHLNDWAVSDGARLASAGRREATGIFYNRRRGGKMRDAATEAGMKAVLALIIIYVGTFFVAIQGASQNLVQASPQAAASAQDNSGQTQAKPIDPAKDADLRSLLELVGARDQVQDGLNNAAEQFRQNLLETVPNNDKGQAFVNAFVAGYQKNVDQNQVTDQLVGIYDKHFAEDEIKGLLQFYGSPLGQKVVSEMPKISREIQAASRAASNRAAREALQALRAQNPEIGQSARLGIGQRRNPQQGQGRPVPSQQQNPQ